MIKKVIFTPIFRLTDKQFFFVSLRYKQAPIRVDNLKFLIPIENTQNEIRPSDCHGCHGSSACTPVGGRGTH